MGHLYIRVESDDRVQVLLTAVLVARDIANADRLDDVDVLALGNWYTPDMELLQVPSTADVSWQRFPDYDSWSVRVAPRVPSDQELTVWRAAKSIPLPDDPGGFDGGVHTAMARYNQHTRQIAEALQMSLSTVQMARAAEFQIYQGIDLCVTPRRWPASSQCQPCGPEDLTIDVAAIRKRDSFLNVVRVLDEACKGRPTEMSEGANFDHDCKFGMPY
jgi:hypothetical protein